MAFSVLSSGVLIPILLCALTVHGFEILNPDHKERLYRLYTKFNPVFRRTSHAQNHYNSVHFAVLTAGNLNDSQFNPLPLQFADVPNPNDNYFAAVPLFNQCPTIQPEAQLVPAYDMIVDNYIRETDFYIFIYYSPCTDCADILQNLASRNPTHTFYIGYVMERLTRSGSSTLPTIKDTLQASNIYFGDVSGQCSGSADECTFPSNNEVYWSSWGPYGQCNEECGGGMRFRYRSCCEVGVCAGTGVQSQKCNTVECAHWSSWGKWTPCSKRCGGGVTERYRNCIGYGNCLDGDTYQSRECNTQKCPSSCFASDSKVRVRITTTKGIEIESKRLDKLKVGEYAESYDPDTNSVAFSQVYFINHDKETGNSSQLIKLVLGTENEEFSLRLHPKHLVYACIQDRVKIGQEPGKDPKCSRPPRKPVTADSVQVGDSLWLRNSSGQFSPKPVIEIGELWTSVRHPMTFSHYIVVDDVLASVHMLDEWLYRVGTAPLRYLYNIHPSITDTWLVKKMVQMWDSGESLFL